MGERKQQRENREDGEPLDCWTHTQLWNTPTQTVLFLFPCQLESGNSWGCTSTADWVNESLEHRWKPQLLMDWLDSRARLTIISRTQIRSGKNDWENTACTCDSCMVKCCGEQTVQRYDTGGRKWHQEPMCKCGCFQAGHEKRRTQEHTWAWLMGMRWVVAGVVKTCSDGALCVRNMSFGFLEACAQAVLTDSVMP